MVESIVITIHSFKKKDVDVEVGIYTDQAWHYDHLPNIVLVPLLLPKQPWPIVAWTPLDPWRCAVVSGTKMLAADPLSLVSWEVGPPWIGLVCSSHPTDARLDWDLGNSEAKSTPQTHCWAPKTIPEPFLLCGRAHYPAEKGHSHWGIPFPWKGVHGLQQYL